MYYQQPIMILNVNTKRESGRKAQLSNIKAAKAVSNIVQTTLGPRSMLKMLMDPIGGIVMTNDGNAILREIDVTHPAAKSMIELARAQDEEVGDGTTSVIILAGEMLAVAEPFLLKDIHPTIIVNAYYKALEDALRIAETLTWRIDTENKNDFSAIIKSCLGTKFSSKWEDLLSDLAIKAVKIVHNKDATHFDCDIKKFAKVEKIPGGSLDECRVLDGIIINKDLVHAQMRKEIRNPRVILLDCNLEYKKGESQTNMEFSNENDFANTLEQERREVKAMCDHILRLKPDVVITEKGVSDLAIHYLHKGNISCIRRLRKTDNNRLAKATGATIVNRPEELQESDVGTNCGLFEVKKIGDEYFTYFTQCKNQLACSILLRGASKDVLNEMERNLQDAMNVARNILQCPMLVSGGGAFEMELSTQLLEKSKSVDGLFQWPYQAVAQALEVIPRTLAQNCGANVIKVMTELRKKHCDLHDENHAYYGINGLTGAVEMMKVCNVWDPISVKKQTLKTAVESACMILRIDDIVSGIKKKERKQAEQPQQPAEGQETVK